MSSANMERNSSSDGDTPSLHNNGKLSVTSVPFGACRTATLGGHIEQCDQCSHRVIAYNSLGRLARVDQ